MSLTWRARLDEHLGVFQAEPLAFHAARLLDSALAIHGLLTLAGHLRLLPERDPHTALYETLASSSSISAIPLRPPSWWCASSFWCSTSSASGST